MMGKRIVGMRNRKLWHYIQRYKTGNSCLWRIDKVAWSGGGMFDVIYKKKGSHPSVVLCIRMGVDTKIEDCFIHTRTHNTFISIKECMSLIESFQTYIKTFIGVATDEEKDNGVDFTIVNIKALMVENSKKPVDKYDYSGIPTNRTGPMWGQRVVDWLFGD